MKIFLALACSFLLAVAGYAETPTAQTDGAAGPVTQQQPEAPRWTSQELDQLLGPIALYPDSLIGLILPASTMPSDVVMADRYMSGNGDPAAISSQPWDESVKGLTYYPNLLKWLDQNIDWTNQLGAAFIAQPSEVMDSIQRLRGKALADGTLVSNDQQKVVKEDGNIYIEQANPDTVYVPLYDPAVVYDDGYTADDGTVILYDGGYAVGPWLYFWPDWRHRGLFRGDFRHHDRPGFAGNVNDPATRAWQPNPNRVHAQFQPAGGVAGNPQFVARTQSLPGVAVIHARRTTLSAPQQGFSGQAAVSSQGTTVGAGTVQAPAGNGFTSYGRGNSSIRATGMRGQSSYGMVSRPVTPVGPVVVRPSTVPTYQGTQGTQRTGSGGGTGYSGGWQGRYGR